MPTVCQALGTRYSLCPHDTYRLEDKGTCNKYPLNRFTCVNTWKCTICSLEQSSVLLEAARQVVRTLSCSDLAQCVVLSSPPPSSLALFYQEKRKRGIGFDDLQACFQFWVSVVRVKSIPFMYPSFPPPQPPKRNLFLEKVRVP